MGIIKKNNEGNGKTIFTIILIILIFAGAFFMINNSKVTLVEESIEISGLYSINLDYSDIEEVKLEDSLPKNLKRTSGIDFFGTYLGNFKADNMEDLKMFLKSRKEPYIYIKTKDNNYIIMNTKDRENTEKLYEDINSKIKK